MQSGLFITEDLMYSKVIPTLNGIAAKHGVSPILAPRCYYVDSEEGVMAMEDLKEIGYDIQGKLEGPLLG